MCIIRAEIGDYFNQIVIHVTNEIGIELLRRSQIRKTQIIQKNHLTLML